MFLLDINLRIFFSHFVLLSLNLNVLILHSLHTLLHTTLPRVVLRPLLAALSFPYICAIP